MLRTAPVVLVLATASCWSASTPVAPPPPPVETGPFQVVLDRAGRCDRYAVEHAGKIHACEHAWDVRTGVYAGRTPPIVAILADGRMISKHESREGLDVDGKRIDARHVYKTALSPDGKHFAYIAEHFTPDYHETIVVRETARWTIEYEVAKPRVEGETYNTALGWLGDRLFVTVASPSCGKNPCPAARVAAVGPRGVATIGADHVASWVGFADDGSAIAIADRASVQVFTAALDGESLAMLEFAAAKLDPDRVRELAVAPGGRLIAMTMFDDHGVVIYKRHDRKFAFEGRFPRLVGTRLVFSRTGDALYATGTGLAVLRRTRTPPGLELPALALDGTGFDIENCADEHPQGFYCNTDHQLRMRLESKTVRVEVHVSPTGELVAATLDAWTAMLRDRFELAPNDIRERVDLGLRAWQTPRGRQLEFHHQVRDSCRPTDAFTRFAEVDGWLWRVTIEAPPDAPQAEIDPLLARLIDSWLGPPAARIARQMPGPTSTTTCGTF